MSRHTTSASVLATFLCAQTGAADDPWENAGPDDLVSTTSNVLRHAVVQRGHDLQGLPGGVPDSDWMRLMTTARHSYEARVSGIYWDDGCPIAVCPFFALRRPDGSVVVPGVASDDDVDTGDRSLGQTVRWIATTSGPALLHALGASAQGLGPSPWILGPVPYDVVYYDTTVFVPRWNNTATQITTLLLQNTTGVAVTGSIYFYDATGVLLVTVPLSVPPLGLQVLVTASVPELVGRSGSAQIAQLGGYGAVVGKAVALEPSTGFTFDTAFTLVPR